MQSKQQPHQPSSNEGRSAPTNNDQTNTLFLGWISRPNEHHRLQTTPVSGGGRREGVEAWLARGRSMPRWIVDRPTRVKPWVLGIKRRAARKANQLWAFVTVRVATARRAFEKRPAHILHCSKARSEPSEPRPIRVQPSQFGRVQHVDEILYMGSNYPACFVWSLLLRTYVQQTCFQAKPPSSTTSIGTGPASASCRRPYRRLGAQLRPVGAG